MGSFDLKVRHLCMTRKAIRMLGSQQYNAVWAAGKLIIHSFIPPVSDSKRPLNSPRAIALNENNNIFAANETRQMRGVQDNNQ
jgi:hypothetical protein